MWSLDDGTQVLTLIDESKGATEIIPNQLSNFPVSHTGGVMNINIYGEAITSGQGNGVNVILSYITVQRVA